MAKVEAVTDIVESEEVLRIAEILRENGIKMIDSLHIACAIHAQADYFLTTDDGILKKSTFITGVNVIDPIGFMKEVLA